MTTEQTTLPEPVVLVDGASGLEEEIGYFVGPVHPLYGVLHRPSGPAATGVVIAPPFLMEFQRNYRRDVLVARALAAAGMAVLRFSYRGQGHSAGGPDELGFAEAVADTAAAVQHLRKAADVGEVVLIGTRLATIVGAAAARQTGVERLVGWDPLVTGKAWLRELSRAAKVQAMRDEDTAPGSLAEQLAERGETEVLGSSLYPALHDSVEDVDLAVAAAGLRRILLVQFGKPDKPKKALTNLADQLDGVEVTGVSEEESWWATRRADYFQAETDRPLSKELIPVTVDWVGEVGV